MYIQMYIQKCICASTYRTYLPASVRKCMYSIYVYMQYTIYAHTHKYTDIIIYVYVHM